MSCPSSIETKKSNQVAVVHSYARRKPEETPCFQILNDHLDSFVAAREIEGRPIPKYVIDEFDPYLRCGILAYGFLRLKCESCSKEHVVAFSCKKRGFCPSCTAKRKIETATHLVENVLPYAPYRQIVITFPISLRYWLISNRELYSKIHAIAIKHIHRLYQDKAANQGIKNAKHGTIGFSQRWGSALNLNPHMHVLCLDAVYTALPNNLVDSDSNDYKSKNLKPILKNIEHLTDEEVAGLITGISKSVIKLLKKRGYLDQEGTLVENPVADDHFEEHESHRAATAASISSKIAFGENAGKKVTRIGAGFGYEEEIPLAKGKLCYSVNGFSAHAKTRIKTNSRDKLEKLIEYMARGPISNERLQITEQGQVKLELKRPFSDGTTHLLFTPEEFIEKLAAIIPPPKTHLVRWGGVFAPSSKIRPQIILKPDARKGFQFEKSNPQNHVQNNGIGTGQGENEADSFGSGSDKGTDVVGSNDRANQNPRKNSSWARMLKKVFQIDVLTCTDCQGAMKPVCAVTCHAKINRYLEHVGIAATAPPPRAPPRVKARSLEFDYESHQD